MEEYLAQKKVSSKILQLNAGLDQKKRQANDGASLQVGAKDAGENLEGRSMLLLHIGEFDTLLAGCCKLALQGGGELQPGAHRRHDVLEALGRRGNLWAHVPCLLCCALDGASSMLSGTPSCCGEITCVGFRFRLVISLCHTV